VVHSNFAGLTDHWMMGVCDGHGGVGHLVSNFVKINLPKILANYIQKKPGDNTEKISKVKKA
jgi:serine/threonine protein phosphatase PrpC